MVCNSDRIHHLQLIQPVITRMAEASVALSVML